MVWCVSSTRNSAAAAAATVAAAAAAPRALARARSRRMRSNASSPPSRRVGEAANPGPPRPVGKAKHAAGGKPPRAPPPPPLPLHKTKEYKAEAQRHVRERERDAVLATGGTGVRCTTLVWAPEQNPGFFRDLGKLPNLILRTDGQKAPTGAVRDDARIPLPPASPLLAALAPHVDVLDATLGRRWEHTVGGKKYDTLRAVEITSEGPAPRRAAAGVRPLAVLPPSTPCLITLRPVVKPEAQGKAATSSTWIEEIAQGRANAVHDLLTRRTAELPPDEEGGRSFVGSSSKSMKALPTALKDQREQLSAKQEKLREQIPRKADRDEFSRQAKRKDAATKLRSQQMLDPPSPTTLRVLQWNCRGARKRLTELRYIVDRIKPHVVLINESQLSAGAKTPEIQGYEVLRRDRQCGAG
eukprot:gene48680-22537_t